MTEILTKIFFDLLRVVTFFVWVWAGWSAHTALLRIGEYFEEKKKRLTDKRVCDMCFSGIEKMKDTLED